MGLSHFLQLVLSLKRGNYIFSKLDSFANGELSKQSSEVNCIRINCKFVAFNIINSNEKIDFKLSFLTRLQRTNILFPFNTDKGEEIFNIICTLLNRKKNLYLQKLRDVTNARNAINKFICAGLNTISYENSISKAKQIEL